MSHELLVKRESFLRSLGTSAVWRGLENISSLAKHVIVAGVIGLSSQLDVFYMANGLLGILIVGTGGVIDTLALPRLVALWKAEDRVGFARLAGGMLALVGLVSAAMALVVFLGSAPISGLARGFEPERRLMLQEAIRWLSLVVLLYAPYRCVASVYRATRQPSIVSQTEFLMTLSILLLIACYPHQPQVLLWSYPAGVAVALVYLFVRASRWVRLWHSPFSEDVRSALGIAPVLLAIQLATYGFALSDRTFQSYLPSGAVGALAYGWVLASMAPGLLAFGNAFMTPFAERHQAGEEGASLLDQLFSLSVLVAVPVGGFLAVFGQGLIRLLLERGGFSGHDTALTAQALTGYAGGLLAILLLPSLNQAFQVMGMSRALFWRVLAGVAMNVALNSLFVLVLGWGVLGVALSLSIGQTAMVAMSLRFLHHRGVGLAWGRHAWWALYVALGTVLALGGASLLNGLTPANWLVLLQGAVFVTAMGLWTLAAPGAEGQLVRATARRFRPGTPS